MLRILMVDCAVGNDFHLKARRNEYCTDNDQMMAIVVEKNTKLGASKNKGREKDVTDCYVL